MTLQSPRVKTPRTADDDPRIGHLLGTGLTRGSQPRAVLIGFPSDEGVRRNGGRQGAAEGPTALRQWLYKLTPDPAHYDDFVNLIGQIDDLGDVEVTGDVDTDQQRLGEVVAPWLGQGTIPIVLGGGHETSYGHFLGYAENEQDVRIVNLDAHADVREPGTEGGHSGSPFRQALEHASRSCQKYSVAGLQPQSVAREHLRYIEAHDGHYTFARDLDRALMVQLYNSGGTYCGDRGMVTFCLDAVDQAFAPGVSAPAVNGLTPTLWLEAAYRAGMGRVVASFDVVELNPRYDRDGATARLAALTVWHFLRGLAHRH